MTFKKLRSWPPEPSVQFSSVAQSCLTHCDPTDCSIPGLPVIHQLPEFTQTHVIWVSDAIQPSHPLSSPSPPDFNFSQVQGLSNESALHIRWPKDWTFSLRISPSNEYSGLICFRMDSNTETPILLSPDVKSWLIWKTLMVGKIEGKRRRGWERMRCLDGITEGDRKSVV